MPVHDFAVFVFVASVPRSIEFYERFGFAVEGRIGDNWASLKCDKAWFMLARATAPIDPTKQSVLFYMHTKDVAALRDDLIKQGIKVGEIAKPEHMPDGEVRIDDPDGYTVLVGQVEP